MCERKMLDNDRMMKMENRMNEYDNCEKNLCKKEDIDELQKQFSEKQKKINNLERALFEKDNILKHLTKRMEDILEREHIVNDILSDKGKKIDCLEKALSEKDVIFKHLTKRIDGMKSNTLKKFDILEEKNK